MAATLLDLFANRLTVSLSARQSSELSRLVSGAREAGGFLIGDLPTLEQILTLASERTLDGTHPFGAQICELLDVANEPFKEARANEAIVAAASIGSFICAVADLVVRFAGRDVSVQLAAAEVLCRFAAESSCELVERSGAAAILVKALRLEVEALGSHPSFLLGSLVDVLGEVASFGEGALGLAVSGALPLVVDILEAGFSAREPVVASALGLLWNALEQTRDILGASLPCELSTRDALLARFREQNATFCLRSERTLVVLRGLLVELCAEGGRASDRALRNEVVIVASLIAARSSARKHFAPSGFTATLLEIAVEATGAIHGRGRGAFATKAAEDRELLRLVWLLVARLASEPSSAALVAASPVIPAIIAALQPPFAPAATPTRANSPMMMRSSSPSASATLMPSLRALQSGRGYDGSAAWDETGGAAVGAGGAGAATSGLETDVVALQLIALSILRRLAQLAPPARWLKSSGAQILDVARKFDASRTSALWLLAEMCADGPGGAADSGAPATSERAASVRAELQALGVVRWALEVFENSTLGAAQREAALVLLCRVCAEAGCRTEFRRYFGVGAVVAAIKTHALPSVEEFAAATSPMAVGTARARTEVLASTKVMLAEADRASGDSGGVAAFEAQRLVAATVACVQQLVVGDGPSEEGFLAEGGVGALLDLCAASASSASGRLTRNQIVSCISDLSSNGAEALLAARAWRGRDGRGAVSMLLSFWTEEEVRRRVPRGGNGEVIDPAHPLDAAVAAAGGESEGPESASAAAVGLRASQRLRRALRASRAVGGVEARVPSEAARSAVESDDLRSKIWSALRTLHVGGEEAAAGGGGELTSAERLNLCVAVRYDSFREAQLWRDVHNALVRQRLNPIAADAVFLKAQLEKADVEVAAVLAEQAEILAARVENEKQVEVEYHRLVEERTKAIGMQDKMAMMAALGGPTMEQRKAAKARRKAMMERSGVSE